ncbi:MAG: cysteine dioxygenase family protein [Streptosporangiales bacterium]|nr:cysteine dioxygenase family protein [Streptosporangiales bacterium]MBO0892524.1 cysteine dioxygenase family protein [Acidothermales bacterium]
MSVTLTIPTNNTWAIDNDAELGVHQAFDRPEVHALLRPERLLWNASELRELVTTVASRFAGELAELTKFEREHRWWARLALTEGVELWLLTWLPGQGTEPHDHGGASGAFTTIRGNLHEDYRYPRRPVRSRSRAQGSAIGFGAGRAHQLRNVQLAPAASVHAYSPPLVPTREYASLADIPDSIPPLPAPIVRIKPSEPA